MQEKDQDGKKVERGQGERGKDKGQIPTIEEVQKQMREKKDLMVSAITRNNVQLFEEARMNIQFDNTEDFNANHFFYDRILKSLENMRFLKIKDLRLSYNNIQSIEGVCYLHMPTLERFYVNSNLISCVKNFRKSDFPRLKTLSFSENFVQDSVFILAETKLPVIDYLIFSMSRPGREDKNPKLECSDFRFIFKMETKKLSNCAIRKIKIHDNFTEKCKRKYQDISFKTG